MEASQGLGFRVFSSAFLLFLLLVLVQGVNALQRVYFYMQDAGFLCAFHVRFEASVYVQRHL